MVTWILVAARDGARVLEQKALSKPFRKISEFPNTEGRKLNRELGSDKPGRSTELGTQTRHSLSQQKEPREQVLEKFLATVCDWIERAANNKEFESLIVIGGPHIVGILKSHLSHRVLEKVKQTLIKDLLHASDEEIRTHMQAARE